MTDEQFYCIRAVIACVAVLPDESGQWRLVLTPVLGRGAALTLPFGTCPMSADAIAAYALLRGHGRIRSPCRQVFGEQGQAVMLWAIMSVVFTPSLLAVVQARAVFVERRALFVVAVGP